MKTVFDKIREQGLLLYEYVRGSQSHGLATETSDVDTGGVYIAPVSEFFSFECREQIADEKNDNMWYEFGKFMELISKSNPNALEALFVPDECVIYEHPIMTELKSRRDEFISQECLKSFGGYAIAQIKRARGLNKMITIKEVERKTPFDFCYTFYGQGSIKLLSWLENRGMFQEACGLVSVPNMREVYAVYYDWGKHDRISGIENSVNKEIGYRGIIAEGSNQLRLSSIPKGEEPICYMSYNESGYTKHCIDYKNFKEWEKNRNPVRYQSNLNKNYDAKNMCESFRLVQMAIELAKGEGFKCDRTNIDREFLLDIKKHKFEYDELMLKLEALKLELDNATENTKLPVSCNKQLVEDIMIDVRKKFYV